MREEIIEFTATGSPRVVSSAIEEYATGQGSLNAIVDHGKVINGFARQIQSRLQVTP